MSDTEVRLAIAVAEQNGMVTAQQADRLGLGEGGLRNLERRGMLEEFDEGIYRHAAYGSDRFDFYRAWWLSLNPRLFAVERYFGSQTPDAIVTGNWALDFHGLGRSALPGSFLVPTDAALSVQNFDTLVHGIDAREWTFGPGFPVTRPTTAIADSLLAGEEIHNVTVAMRDAILARSFDPDLFIRIIGPAAAQYGDPPGDGAALFRRIFDDYVDDLYSSNIAFSRTPTGIRAELELKVSIPRDDDTTSNEDGREG